MNRSLTLKLLVAGMAIVIGMTGCQMKPKGPTPIPGSSGNVGSGNDGFGPTGGGILNDADLSSAGGEGTGGIPQGDFGIYENMLRDEETFRPYTVHFDFDRSTIRASDRPNVEAVANHLRANSAHKVLVEGHCDERGTEGYNMALGERRALSVREYLINLGISADRVFTTSFGEASPAVMGTTESAYAANRRGEFILLLPRN